ncbi:MAG: translesion DNA synthesis-associated protein ImuA [Pseudomonadota bacterium]
MMADEESVPPADPVFFSPEVWRANSLAQHDEPVCDTGYPALNALLPGGGWPITRLVECLSDHDGVGELRLLLPALAQLARRRSGWVVWIAPPYLPNAPALLQWGLAPERMLIIHPRSASDAAWAAEQAVRSGTCIAVLWWADTLASGHAVTPSGARKAGGSAQRLSMPKFTRRLQLAAATQACWPILMRHTRARRQASAAAVRLSLQVNDGQRDVHVHKVRGGRPGVVPHFDAGIDVGATFVRPQSPSGDESTP